MRILIAVPTFETIMPDTFKAIWDMDKGGHDVDFEFVRGYDVATARNRIAQKAIDGGYDYVMMVDNDVTPKPDALVRLLSHGEDVVTGYYAHRGKDNLYNGRTCVCRVLQPNGTPYFNYPLESEYTASEMEELKEAGELVRIHGGGMGCILIRTSVFERLFYPWYDWINYADENRGMLSEDLYFCEKLHAEEIPIYVDPNVPAGHMLRHIQWVE